jgi:hypothetical protein
MSDYIRFTVVHQAEKSVVLDNYIKKGMEKPKAHQSSAHCSMVMTTFKADAATPLVAHDTGAFSKPVGKNAAAPH